jgi:hypothetical protein
MQHSMGSLCFVLSTINIILKTVSTVTGIKKL